MTKKKLINLLNKITEVKHKAASRTESMLKRYWKPAAIIIFLSYAFIARKSLLVFSILTLFSGLFNYYHDMKNKTVFDMRMGLFLGIMIAYKYGMWDAITFYALSQVLPNVLAGGRMDGLALVFHFIAIIFMASATIFPDIDILLLGIILVTIEGTLGIAINLSLGLPPFIAVTASLFAISVRIVYFLTIGTLVEFIFQFI